MDKDELEATVESALEIGGTIAGALLAVLRVLELVNEQLIHIDETLYKSAMSRGC